MALVERLLTSRSEGRLSSVESRHSVSPANVGPAPAVRNRWALDRAAALESLQSFARHPFAAVLAKALGIALLLLGLAAIGAYATLKGLKAHSVFLPEHASASMAVPAGEWLMSQTLAAREASSSPKPATSSAPAEPAPPATPSPGVTSDGKVILNSASVEDLRRLPGVGQKRAEAILALRQKLGRFRRTSDLLRVRGLGPKRLKQMLPHLVLDAPSAPQSSPSAVRSSEPQAAAIDAEQQH